MTVSQATNEALGIVKGSTTTGQIAVEADGSMSLNGYDGMQHDIQNLTELTQGRDTPVVPAYIVGNSAASSSFTFSQNTGVGGGVNLNFRQASRLDGVLTSHSTGLPKASSTAWGIMSPDDKSKLDSMLAIKSLNDSLSLDENGQLSVVGGGGGSVNLLSAYTNSPTDTDAYNASYINGELYKGTKLGLGSTLSRNVNIYSVALLGRTTAQNSVAIGFNAISSNQYSTALGIGARTTRTSEVSIGGTGTNYPATRFLANVAPGQLDTDAVNLSQLKSAKQKTWLPNTTYQVGELVLNEGKLYEVSAEFTSGTTFDATNLSELGGGSYQLPDAVVVLNDGSTHNLLKYSGYGGSGMSWTTATFDTSSGEKTIASGLTIPWAKYDSHGGLMQRSEANKLASITPLTEMEQTRVSNLPPAVVTGFEITDYNTDNVTLHLDTKDLATGGVAVQPLTLNAAVGQASGTTGSAGIMSATQATQLATLAAAYEAEEKGTTLYSGTASVNSITLSEAATSFDHLTIVGEYMGMGSSAIKQSVSVNFYPTTDAKAFQMDATDLTVGDTPMETTLQDIWQLSDDGLDLDLVSATKCEKGAATLTCTPETTSNFTIVKVVGFGKM